MASIPRPFEAKNNIDIGCRLLETKLYVNISFAHATRAEARVFDEWNASTFRLFLDTF